MKTKFPPYFLALSIGSLLILITIGANIYFQMSVNAVPAVKVTTTDLPSGAISEMRPGGIFLRVMGLNNAANADPQSTVVQSSSLGKTDLSQYN
jgi:hypothetical protein